MTQRSAQRHKLIAQRTPRFFNAGEPLFLLRDLRIERADHFVLKGESGFEIIQSCNQLVGS